MHYSMADLDWLDLGGTGWQRASATLSDGDSADNPASTKRLIYGPALVTYDLAPGGGIRVHVGSVS